MRPETGPMKFGDDWTGLFIRGDNAAAYAMYLDDVLNSISRGEKPSPIYCACLRGLQCTMGQSREGANVYKGPTQRAILVTDEPKKD